MSIISKWPNNWFITKTDNLVWLFQFLTLMKSIQLATIDKLQERFVIKTKYVMAARSH